MVLMHRLVVIPGLVFWWICVVPSNAAAESVAAKNKDGNRLFQKGQYQDAEKAYLDAQLEDPGRPELLYNLGNALIKQKKFDKATQSLRQAISRGDRGLQANGWYNLGNSLFEAGNYRDSVQSYIQALRINPADRDAKHNLELAWRKIQEQKQNSTGKNQKDDQQKSGTGKDQQESQNNQGNKQDQSKSQSTRENKQPEMQQQSQAERKDGSMTKDRALQILDAMKNQELMDQKMLRERQAKRKTGGRDW